MSALSAAIAAAHLLREAHNLPIGCEINVYCSCGESPHECGTRCAHLTALAERTPDAFQLYLKLGIVRCEYCAWRANFIMLFEVLPFNHPPPHWY